MAKTQPELKSYLFAMNEQQITRKNIEIKETENPIKLEGQRTDEKQGTGVKHS